MAPEKSSGPTELNMGRCNKKYSLAEIKKKAKQWEINLKVYIIYRLSLFA